LKVKSFYSVKGRFVVKQSMNYEIDELLFDKGADVRHKLPEDIGVHK